MIIQGLRTIIWGKETKIIIPEAQNIILEAQIIIPEAQNIILEAQIIILEAQIIILEAQNIILEVQRRGLEPQNNEKTGQPKTVTKSRWNNQTTRKDSCVSGGQQRFYQNPIKMKIQIYLIILNKILNYLVVKLMKLKRSMGKFYSIVTC